MTGIAIPEAPAELEDMLTDGARMTAILKEGRLGDVIKAYQKNIAAKDPDIQAQIREGVQLGMAEFLNASGGEAKDAPPVDMSPGPSARPYIKGLTSAERALNNRHAPGLKTEGIFADSAELFQAIQADRVRVARNPELLAKRERYETLMNSFGSEVPADGGFLIPENLRSDLLQVALESAVVRPRAQVIPMDSLRVPIPMVDSTSNASSIFGGITAYWTEEAANLTESQASFGRVVLDAKKLTAYAEVPNELLADAPAFSAFFDSIFPKAIAWFEDVAFMTGTATGEPEGFIGCPATAQVAAESGQPTATILWENIVKMFSRMLPTALTNAVWIASIDTFPQLATMALSVGTGGSAVWLGNMQSPGSAAPPVSILGRPVIFTEKTSALGTAGDINFVDLSYYLIGDRQMMQSSSSTEFKFQSDKTAFRIIERLTGMPWIQSPITPKNSGPTLSPFVNLATRP
jgi:HK97 family phage major capsid protein